MEKVHRVFFIVIENMYSQFLLLKNITTPNHVHPLQVENCDSNSRLVVDEYDNVKSGWKGLKNE